MYILKTWEDGAFIPWTSSANPSNINKLITLHEYLWPGKPYVVDRA